MVCKLLYIFAWLAIGIVWALYYFLQIDNVFLWIGSVIFFALVHMFVPLVDLFRSSEEEYEHIKDPPEEKSPCPFSKLDEGHISERSGNVLVAHDPIRHEDIVEKEEEEEEKEEDIAEGEEDAREE